MNRNDRRIAQTALVVAVLALIGLWLTDGDQQTPVVQQSKDSTQQQGKGNYYGKGRYRQHTSAPMAVGDLPARHVEEFYFDPNSADSTQLLRLGLPAWMVRNIYRYRARGGVYRTKRDFARTYGLTKKDYQRLERIGGYVSVDQLDEIEGFPQSAKQYFVINSPTPQRLKINKLSLQQLRRHPYINYYQAKTIVDYRRLHGDIKSLQDLRFSKDFTEDAIRRLEPYVEY